MRWVSRALPTGLPHSVFRHRTGSPGPPPAGAAHATSRSVTGCVAFRMQDGNHAVRADLPRRRRVERSLPGQRGD